MKAEEKLSSHSIEVMLENSQITREITLIAKVISLLAREGVEVQK